MKKYNTEEMIGMYNSGESLNSIARKYGTYASTIRRKLIRLGVPLRHDSKTAGNVYVKDGEKLLEWAKDQDRLVTKKELADVVGRKRLSASYISKYPELSQYLNVREQKQLKESHKKLYDWLNENSIPYRPADRKTLNVTLDAVLLGEYSGIALHIDEKPSCVSESNYTKRMNEKINRAYDKKIHLILVSKEQLNDLDGLKDKINSYK